MSSVSNFSYCPIPETDSVAPKITGFNLLGCVIATTVYVACTVKGLHELETIYKSKDLKNRSWKIQQGVKIIFLDSLRTLFFGGLTYLSYVNINSNS
ncbi:MAG: hypothetical protein H0W88_04755 [Parachlamydiaceae bacterium]|nr:hypothetical protein [Parachlamydiaceae bacterium]